MRIDKASGEVTAEYDGSVLQPDGGRPRDVRAVLNGIAYDPDSKRLFVTGKYWPKLYEIELVGGR